MGHENNGHRDYKRPLLNGKLYISGSESLSKSRIYGGAVVAAKISPQF
jgi:monoamine oxidase